MFHLLQDIESSVTFPLVCAHKNNVVVVYIIQSEGKCIGKQLYSQNNLVYL